MKRALQLMALCVWATCVLAAEPVSVYSGRVVDAASGRPIAHAIATIGGNVVRAGEDGRFAVSGAGERVGFRAPGYRRSDVPVEQLNGKPADIALQPFAVKALYLTVYGIGSSVLRESALKLLDETELNALVIDLKGDRGLIPFHSADPLAASIGARSLTTIRDLHALAASLKQRGIYTIARIVTFKDDPLARARPDLAVHTARGAVWRDREGFAWIDPFRTEAWDYSIGVAVEAAAAGFDEVQFDYVRFPDAEDLQFSRPSTERSRTAAVAAFLERAREKLAPYNVFVSADIFGYVCWNIDDTGIGQALDALLPHVDYLSPMLYPSGFHLGIPGYKNPMTHPYEIVRLSLDRARERTGVPGVRFRPWLQAFRDYAFDRRPFDAQEIRAQIRAAEEAGSAGWMLWNPRNVYSTDGLRAR